MRWRTGASHLSIQGTITAPAQSLEERLTSLVYYLTSRPSRTTVWSRWEKGCRYTHSTRCLLKNEPCTYQKKFDWLRLHASLQNVFDRFTLTPAIQIQRVNFPHLNGVHIFFCLAWYNFFLFEYQSTIFFFFENQSTIFVSKKTRTPPPPPGYEMGGPLASLLSKHILLINIEGAIGPCYTIQKHAYPLEGDNGFITTHPTYTQTPVTCLNGEHVNMYGPSCVTTE